MLNYDTKQMASASEVRHKNCRSHRLGTASQLFFAIKKRADGFYNQSALLDVTGEKLRFRADSPGSDQFRTDLNGQFRIIGDHIGAGLHQPAEIFRIIYGPDADGQAAVQIGG